MEEQKVIVLEANPTDARLKIAPDGIVQTLKSRMGTGGECAFVDDKEKSKWKRKQ